MKHLLKLKLSLFIVFIFIFGATSVYGYTQKSIKVVANTDEIKLNGTLVAADNFSYQNTTYVQLRTICEMLNKNPIWDGTTRTINIINSETKVKPTKQTLTPKGQKTIKVLVNSVKVTVNGQLVTADNFGYNGYTYVRLRDMCNLLGKDIVWEQVSRTIQINDRPVAAPILTQNETNPTNNDVLVVIEKSGTAETLEYKINNSSWSAYYAPVAISENSTVYARCFDRYGNVSSISSLSIGNIDKIPPTMPVINSSNTQLTNKDIIISIDNWGDAVTREYKLDEGKYEPYTEPVTIQANVTIYARGIDSIGNISQIASLKIENIDKTPPSKPLIKPSTTTKTQKKVTVTIENWDDAIVKEYKIDDDEWEVYTIPFSMESNGIISARGMDSVGNISEIAVYQVKNIKQTIQQIAENSEAVVLLKLYDFTDEEIGSASGFIVSSDGKVVTNYHVIDYVFKIEAYTAKNVKYDVKGVLAYDVNADLAIIQLNNAKDLPVVELGNSDDLKLGEEIVAIGSPLGLKNTVSNGIVSSIRKGLYRKECMDIQISAPISSGSSGGALFNMYGEVVGITYAGETGGQNLNYAIPINEIKPLIASTSVTPLIDVVKKEYPYFEIAKSIYDKYHLFLKTIGFDLVLVVEDEEDPKELYVILDMYNDNLIKLSNAVTAGQKNMVEMWLKTIIKQVQESYPDKNVNLAVYYVAYSDIDPSDISDQYVTYDPIEHIWYINMPLIITDGSNPPNFIWND